MSLFMPSHTIWVLRDKCEDFDEQHKRWPHSYKECIEDSSRMWESVSSSDANEKELRATMEKWNAYAAILENDNTKKIVMRVER